MMALEKDRALMVTTRRDAEKMLTEKVGTPSGELVQVAEWIPIPDDGSSTELWLLDGGLIFDLIHFAPVVKDVDVDWCYDRRYLEDAYRMLDIFNKTPIFLSAKIASPLWVETVTNPEKRKDDDIVILIAPRIAERAEVKL